MNSILTKQQVIEDLTLVFQRLQELLADLTDDQITTPLEPSQWTVKYVMAHLWFWQQASVARMEAAIHDAEPDYPDWWELFGPDPEEDVDRTNAWNYAQNRDKPWPQVYASWNDQFQHYLNLVKQVPEQDLLQVGRFAWMGKYRLLDSTLGSCGHHQEHYDGLGAWLKLHSDQRVRE
jgi:hypothetical protein